MIFPQNPIVETKDLDENTLLDIDEKGQLCSITIEHPREKIGIPEVEYEKISAQIFPIKEKFFYEGCIK